MRLPARLEYAVRALVALAAAEPRPGSTPATVTRIVRLGFEVRVEMRLGDPTGGPEAWAQVTRGTAQRLDLAAGDPVHVRPTAEATPLPRP